jgi:hypothetical protein
MNNYVHFLCIVAKNLTWEKDCCLLVHLDQRSRWTIAINWRPSSVVYKLFTFQASSPKPLGQMEPNLAGMFLRWSSTMLLFFAPVGYSTWLPGPIMCSDWLKFQRSSSLKLMNWLNPNCKWMIIHWLNSRYILILSLESKQYCKFHLLSVVCNMWLSYY